MLKPFKVCIGTDSTGRPLDGQVVWADDAQKRIRELETALRQIREIAAKARGAIHARDVIYIIDDALNPVKTLIEETK